MICTTPLGPVLSVVFRGLHFLLLDVMLNLVAQLKDQKTKITSTTKGFFTALC